MTCSVGREEKVGTKAIGYNCENQYDFVCIDYCEGNVPTNRTSLRALEVLTEYWGTETRTASSTK